MNLAPVTSNESGSPVPLGDGQWAELVRPLRQYSAAAGSAATWEGDFRRQVDAVVALFRDRETPADEWLKRAMPFLELAIKTAGSERRLREVAASMHHLLSARTKSQPRRGSALSALREVEAQAARLGAALDAAIRDPWLSVAAGSEVIRAEFRKHSVEQRQPTGSARRPAESAIETVFGETRDTFLEGAAHVARLRDAARQSVNSLQGHQLRGRPPETAARMPGEFLCAVAKHHAPSPGRGCPPASSSDRTHPAGSGKTWTDSLRRGPAAVASQSWPTRNRSHTPPCIGACGASRGGAVRDPCLGRCPGPAALPLPHTPVRGVSKTTLDRARKHLGMDWRRTGFGPAPRSSGPSCGRARKTATAATSSTTPRRSAAGTRRPSDGRLVSMVIYGPNTRLPGAPWITTLVSMANASV